MFNGNLTMWNESLPMLNESFPMMIDVSNPNDTKTENGIFQMGHGNITDTGILQMDRGNITDSGLLQLDNGNISNANATFLSWNAWMEIVTLWNSAYPVTNESLDYGLFITNNSSNATFVNETDMGFEFDDVFQNVYIRVSLIIAYTIVFLCCFFGNLTVMAVVVLHRRMRTATNFFLANLALADICVGLFCVYQNLMLYLTTGWSLGDFFCRMYHFVHGLSYTASILILTVISLERYVVIVYPIWGRRYITINRLRIILVLLWILSAVYNSPRLIVYGTVKVPSFSEVNATDTLCINKRQDYNSVQFDFYNFIFLFVFPMLVMCILYAHISLTLWRSEKIHSKKKNQNPSSSSRCSCLRQKRQITKPQETDSKTPQLRKLSSIKDKSRHSFFRITNPHLEKLMRRRSVDTFDDSSCDDEDSLEWQNNSEDQYEDNTINTRKKNSFKLPARSRGGSFRGSSRRVSANITFAEVKTEESGNKNLCDMVPSSILDRVHKSSVKMMIRDAENIRNRTKNPATDYEAMLLMNQPNELVASTPLSEPDIHYAPITHYSGAREEKPFLQHSGSQRSQVSDIGSIDIRRGPGKIKRTGSKILKSRRKIIRLLVAIVVSFAICNLPYHARKFWQSWSSSYNGASTVSIFLTISTTLILYMNSGFNPFLYAFLSANFRKSVKEVLMCQTQLWKKRDFTPHASNSSSRLTSLTSTGPLSTGSISSAV